MAIGGLPAQVVASVRGARDVLSRRVVAYPVAVVLVGLVATASLVVRRRVESRLGLSPYDEMLYMKQARSLNHSAWLGPYDNLTLVKVPGYSLFLSMCDRLGLPVKDTEQVVACFAALLVGVCVLLVTKRLRWAVLAYAVCAFDPILFSSWAADYMRDTLFASISLIVVTALFLTSYFLVFGRAIGWSVVAAGVGGLAVAAYVLTREEGLTVLPLAAVAVGALPVMHLLRTRPWRSGVRRWIGRTLLRAVPSALVLSLAVGVPIGMVLHKNQQRYGVATLSEMAGGSFMDAYAQWQRVQVGPATYRIPITEGQRRAVYRVSPTARLLAPTLEDPANPWRLSGCTTAPKCDYHGGWMTWALRDAAAAAGAYTSAPHAEAFFADLAREISDACSEDRLTCSVKLPSAFQEAGRISVAGFVDSFERVTGYLLTSRDEYLALTGLVIVTPEQRAEFVSIAHEVPPTDAAARRQLADYGRHLWQYQALNSTYTVLLPVGSVLGVLLLVSLVATRRGRRAMSPLAALAIALLAGAGLRLTLLAVLDAADYDAEPRYVFPARELLLAFAVVALVEGLSRLDLRRLGALVRPEGEEATGPARHEHADLPGETTMPLAPGRFTDVARKVAFGDATEGFRQPVGALAEGGGGGPAAR